MDSSVSVGLLLTTLDPASVAEEETNPPKTFLISPEAKRISEFYINVLAFIVTSLVGMIANSINIAAYWRQGLKESIVFSFFALSLSDLVVVTMPLMAASCYASRLLLPDSNVDFVSLHYASSAWLRHTFYSLSASITAILSLERCCCVILPFKVKSIFSLKRTTVTLTVIFVFHVLCVIPIYATHRLQWRSMSFGNSSDRKKLRVTFLPYRNPIEAFNFTLMGIVLPTISQVIVTASVVILINGLRKSSKFRRTLANTGNNKVLKSCSKEQEKTTEAVTGIYNETNGYVNTSEDNSGGLSKRDARLVKTMVILVFIFSMCNIPFLMTNYAYRLVPELNIGRAYHNTFAMTHAILYILGTMNASANMFVYYRTSTRFREAVRSIFGFQIKE